MSASPPPLDATAGPGPEYTAPAEPIPPAWAPTPAPVPPAPAAPRTLGGKRIALFGGIVAGVVALALVAWFVVVPWLSAPATTTTRVPDLITQPAWSDPVHLVWQTGSGVLDLTDTMTGDIAVVSSADGNGLAGIDLRSREILWQAGGSLLTYSLEPSRGLVMHPNDDLSTLDRLDPRTGGVTATLRLGATEYPVGSSTDSVLVYDPGSGTLCDLRWDQSGCRWKTFASDNCDGGIHAWGTTPWVSACSAMIDGRTGKPAPFGSDAGTSAGASVTYFGLGAHTVRLSSSANPDTPTYQLWDTTRDKGIGSPVIAGGYAGAWGVDSALFLASNVDQSAVTAYSWTDFAEQWSVPVDAGIGTAVSLRGTTAILDGNNSLTAVATTTGQSVGHLDNVSLVTSGSRVVYLRDVITGALLAYDGSSAAFAKLWQIDQPAGTPGAAWTEPAASPIQYAVAAGHIVAYQYDNTTGEVQLWVLEG